MENGIVNRTEKEDILYYMSSTELAANLFRITQTDEVLKNKNINNEDDACITHHKVRQTIRKVASPNVQVCFANRTAQGNLTLLYSKNLAIFPIQ